MSEIDRIEDNAVAAIRDAINSGDDFRVWVRAALLEYGEIVREECAKSATQPDGYTIMQADGHYVGAWRSLETAQMIVNRSPTIKGERVVAFALIEAAMKEGS